MTLIFRAPDGVESNGDEALREAVRRIAEGDDRFAAHMAEQTLALPEDLLRR